MNWTANEDGSILSTKEGYAVQHLKGRGYCAYYRPTEYEHYIRIHDWFPRILTPEKAQELCEELYHDLNHKNS